MTSHGTVYSYRTHWLLVGALCLASLSASANALGQERQMGDSGDVRNPPQGPRTYVRAEKTASSVPGTAENIALNPPVSVYPLAVDHYKKGKYAEADRFTGEPWRKWKRNWAPRTRASPPS